MLSLIIDEENFDVSKFGSDLRDFNPNLYNLFFERFDRGRPGIVNPTNMLVEVVQVVQEPPTTGTEPV